MSKFNSDGNLDNAGDLQEIVDIHVVDIYVNCTQDLGLCTSQVR